MARMSIESVMRGRISRVINFANRNFSHELNESEHFEVNTFSFNQGGIWTAYLMVVRKCGAACVILKSPKTSTEHKALARLLRACKRRDSSESR